jgi:GT2 family glycosyltransferase
MPLVTVLIASKDRPDDLRRTLRRLQCQQYPELGLLVIDDGSRPPLQNVVNDEAPQATYLYHEQSAGQSRRRSEGFMLAKGDYILQLDDDSCPIEHDAISKCVRMMQSHPAIGALNLFVFNGQSLPSDISRPGGKFHSAFVGCGVFFRSSVLRQTAGYRDFFGNEWEEEELGLQLMKAGSAIYFYPDVLIHHHVSPQNRLTSRTWMRGFRNKLWAIVMHFPLRRLPVEMTWVLAIASFDAIRLFRIRSFAQGVLEFFKGLPRAWRLRAPMSNLVLRRYDALRFGSLQTDQEYADPPKLGLDDIRTWFQAWWNRPRQRSVWDRKEGDIGQSPTVKYAHEYKQEAVRPRDL